MKWGGSLPILGITRDKKSTYKITQKFKTDHVFFYRKMINLQLCLLSNNSGPKRRSHNHARNDILNFGDQNKLAKVRAKSQNKMICSKHSAGGYK